MKKTILLCSMMFIAAFGMGKTIKTLVLTTTPQMHCGGCENKIKGNIRFEKGVKKITTNVSSQTVTSEYDADKTTPKNIINAFTKIGYKATEVKKANQTK